MSTFQGTDEELQARGVDAARILENELFRLVESELRDEYHAAWEKEEDPTKRDRLWHDVRAIGAYRRKLESIKANGEHSGKRLLEFTRR